MVPFLTQEQSSNGDAILLVAMGTGMDEDVSRFSGCLVSARARACVNLQPLSERIRRTRTPASVQGGCASCRRRTCARGAASAGASPLWKDIVLYAERSERLRERIGPEEAFPSGLLVL